LQPVSTNNPNKLGIKPFDLIPEILVKSQTNKGLQ